MVVLNCSGLIRFDFVGKVKEKIAELEEILQEIDVEKIICLDEVYECRWDCMMLGVAHPHNTQNLIIYNNMKGLQ